MSAIWKKHIVTASLLSGLVFLATPAFAADDAVMAVVNGDKILRKDVEQAVKQLSVPGAKAGEVAPMVLEQIINEKLIDDAIVAAKIEETEDYKKRLDILRTQLAKQMYIETFLKKKLTDSAVRGEYNKFVKENKGKEEAHARHILVPTEVEAKQVIKDLDGGADFADLARKRSSGPTAPNGGDLGYFVREEMLADFSKAAFALKKGAYTKTPVKTQFGWHIIKLEDKRSRKVPELKEVEGAIRNKLGQEALQELVTDLRKKASIQRFDAQGNPVKPEKDAKKK